MSTDMYYFTFFVTENRTYVTVSDILGLVESKKVQVGKDQEKAQSEKDSHSKNQGGEKPN